MLIIKKNESDATLRRIFFQIVDSADGMTPETAEAGGQPQVSVNGDAFGTQAIIGVLVAIGNGRYYAELTQAGINIADRSVIEGRYKSANTAEAVGTTVQVLEKMPLDVDTNVSTIIAKLPTNYIMGSAVLTAKDDEIDAILEDTGTTLPATLANATYGLSALQVLLDAIDTSTELTAKFTEIKGAGWTTETLAAIDVLIDAIKAKTDLIPADIATQLDTNIPAIKAKTDTIVWTDVTAIIARIGAFTGSGWNTILGVLKAMSRKDTGVTLPTDIGGTFDNTTDSLEAIKDQLPAAIVGATLNTGVLQSLVAISATEPLRVYRGDYLPAGTFTFSFGTAWDCSGGKKIYFCVKKTADGPEKIDIECTVSDEANAAGSVPALNLETYGITPGSYIYEFERRDSDGTKPRTVMTGVFIVGNDSRKS